MQKNTKNQKLVLIVFLFVMIFAIGSIAFAYFESYFNYENGLAFNTTTGGRPFAFTAYSNTEININVSKSEMGINNVSENTLKTDNATVTVDLSSTIEEKISCSYDVVWVWDSEEKYLEPTTTLPYTSADGKVYPYEFSVIFDGKEEINITELDWQTENGVANKYAYLARNQRITADSPTPVRINHTISINIYNLPIDQKDLFKKTFLSHLEIRNNECKIAQGPQIEDVKVIAKTSNSIDIEVITDDSENVKLSYYYKEADSDDFILLEEDTPDKTARFPGLKQDTTYVIKVVAENEDGSSEYLLDVTTDEIEETDIRIKDDINWTENGDAWIELVTDNLDLDIKYKVNDEEKWHDYTGPIEGLHHGDNVTAVLTDGTNETGEVEFLIEDTLPPKISMQITQTNAIEGHPIPLGVTLTDNESGISLAESKWYLDFESGKVGIDSDKWDSATAFTSASGILNLLPDEPGVYYIHILAVDNALNKAEQVLGQFTVTGAVAETGGVNYSSIQAAINTVPTNNVETVVNLLMDTQENNMTTLTGQNIILNLGGHTVDGTFSNSTGLFNAGDSILTITNGAMQMADGNVINNQGTLYLTDTLSLENYGLQSGLNGYPAVTNGNIGILDIEGSTIKSLYSAAVYNKNVATIDSANLVSDNYTAIYNQNNATVKNVTATSWSSTIMNEDAVLTVEGGSYTTQNGNALNNNGSATITGNTVFSGSSGYPIVFNTNGSTLNMTSGEIISTYGDNVQNFGTITLTDVTVTTNNTTGIYNLSGNVYLNGNTHITSGDAANAYGTRKAGVYNEAAAYMYIEDNTIIENVMGNLVANYGNLYINDNAKLQGELNGSPSIINYNNAVLYINGGSVTGPDISHTNGNVILNYGVINTSGTVTLHNELSPADPVVFVNYDGYLFLDDDKTNIYSNLGTLLWIMNGDVTISGGTYTSTSSGGLRIDAGKLQLSGGDFNTYEVTLDIEGGEVTIHGGTYHSAISNALNLISDTAIIEPIDSNTSFSSGGTYPTIYVGNPSITVGSKIWAEFTNVSIVNSLGNAIQNDGNILIRDNIIFGSSADYSFIVNYTSGVAELRNITVKSRYNQALTNYGLMLLNNAQILDGNADTIIVQGLSIIENSGTLNVKNGSLLQGLNGNAIYNMGTTNLIDNVSVVGANDNYPTLVNTASGTLNAKLESGSVPPEISHVNGNALVNSGTATITGNAKIYNTGDASTGAMAVANQGIMTIDSAIITSVNCIALYNTAVPPSSNPNLDTLVVKGTSTISSGSGFGSFRTNANSRTNVQGNITILGTSDGAVALYNMGIITMNGTAITVRATMSNAFLNEVGATATLTGITIDNNGLDVSAGIYAPSFVNAGATTATNVKFISNYTALYNVQGTVYTTGGSIVSRNNSSYYAIINASGATTSTSGTTITSYRLDQ